ncbi:hypothetical protein [Roseibium sp.]|uniref:hypothetical protein n=1 Tax=Roseibium sp. TaxID=1936156 RepID=UPI003A977AF8
MAFPSLTILNLYHLTFGASEFTRAITALSERVQAEGHPGVLGYRFFVNGHEKTARAVVDYRDAAAWIGHHDLAMGWPEMKALHDVAHLEDVTFLGTLTPEIQDWIDRSSLKAKVHSGNRFAAGFIR